MTGIRVVELASLGPGPHAAMILADLGADVVRVERPAGRVLQIATGADVQLRGRRSVAADLKTPEGVAAVRDLASRADVVLEGLRPGVAERLGVGPEDLCGLNPRLVYGRITGWGQHGPRAQSVGHDINYIGLTGALNAMGRADDSPPPPLNLVGDFGGGSMLLVLGVLAALLERERSGRGQVVDAAMVDGVATLSQMVVALRNMGAWSVERQANLLDGAAPFYDTYRCADGRFVAVGALEPQFYAALVEGLDAGGEGLLEQNDRAGWPRMREVFSRRFASRTRDEWTEHFAASDACVTPVLNWHEAVLDEHLSARGTYVESGGVVQAAPSPRFSRTPGRMPHPPVAAGSSDVEEIVADWAD